MCESAEWIADGITDGVEIAWAWRSECSPIKKATSDLLTEPSSRSFRQLELNHQQKQRLKIGKGPMTAHAF